MTRKDYVLIAATLAAVLRASRNADEIRAVRAVGLALAAELAQDNPRFDFARFLKAAGVQ